MWALTTRTDRSPRRIRALSQGLPRGGSGQDDVPERPGGQQRQAGDARSAHSLVRVGRPQALPAESGLAGRDFLQGDELRRSAAEELLDLVPARLAVAHVPGEHAQDRSPG